MNQRMYLLLVAIYVIYSLLAFLSGLPPYENSILNKPFIPTKPVYRYPIIGLLVLLCAILGYTSIHFARQKQIDVNVLLSEM